MPERAMRAERAPTRRSAAGVSLKPPLPPFVKGVRRAAVMTMSSAFLVRRAERPVGWRWEATWPTRDCAVDDVSLGVLEVGWGGGRDGWDGMGRTGRHGDGCCLDYDGYMRDERDVDKM
jgi:hypothetical protein